MKGTGQILGDIVHVPHDPWTAETGEKAICTTLTRSRKSQPNDPRSPVARYPRLALGSFWHTRANKNEHTQRPGAGPTIQSPTGIHHLGLGNRSARSEEMTEPADDGGGLRTASVQNPNTSECARTSPAQPAGAPNRRSRWSLAGWDQKSVPEIPTVVSRCRA